MMTGQDDYADELLSAYLDGEVSCEEREQIVQRLARSAEHTSRLEALQELQEALRDLPQYRLSPEVEQRILREIERLAAEAVHSALPQEIEAELLSAYVDGEVSPEEREQIAQRLATSSAYANRLEALRALQEALRDLPRFRLSREVEQRILREIERLAANSAHPAPEEEPEVIEAELLSAYVDGEVSPEERQQVERSLAGSAACRSQVEEFRTLGDELRGLSAFHLDASFADRVMRRIEIEAEAGKTAEVSPEAVVEPARRSEPATVRSGWSGFVGTALAVAAAVVLMVTLRPAPTPPTPLQSPLTLIDRKLRERLVLVYEVTVTPQGVDSGAFFQLLKRHGIQVLDTVPVSERERRSLLSCRFLKDAQPLDAGAAGGMDEIRLYLVYCSAQQADAMWDELRKRPEGFGSFFMNLTTRREGGGVVTRLCDSAGVRRRMRVAFPLAARLCAHRSSRRLGTFGTVGYIAPDLLQPPAAPGEARLREAEKAAASRAPDDPDASVLNGDFPCELLFVVRNLYPFNGDEPAEATPGTNK